MSKFNVNVSLKLITRCYVNEEEVQEFVEKLQSCGLLTYIDSNCDDDYEVGDNVAIMVFKLTK